MVKKHFEGMVEGVIKEMGHEIAKDIVEKKHNDQIVDQLVNALTEKSKIDSQSTTNDNDDSKTVEQKRKFFYRRYSWCSNWNIYIITAPTVT